MRCLNISNITIEYKKQVFTITAVAVAVTHLGDMRVKPHKVNR
ncbi:hypothetical protein PMAN_b0323 [Pseudoalteromonas marina]|nr:hypothetical protein PMAN_b0323 [Pseudoalteromonas marina]